MNNYYISEEVKKNRDSLYCSICRLNPNIGKYFTDASVIIGVKRDHHEVVKSRGVLYIFAGSDPRNKTIWNLEWKVYPIKDYLDWEYKDYRHILEDKQDEEYDKEKDYFAILCANCFCSICFRLTEYGNSYDGENWDEFEHKDLCLGNCRCFWDYWPEKDKKKFIRKSGWTEKKRSMLLWEKKCEVCKKNKSVFFVPGLKKVLCEKCRKEIINNNNYNK